MVLVAQINQEKAKDKKGLIDYNVHVFQDAVKAVFARQWEEKEGDGAENGHAVQDETEDED